MVLGPCGMSGSGLSFGSKIQASDPPVWSAKKVPCLVFTQGTQSGSKNGPRTAHFGYVVDLMCSFNLVPCSGATAFWFRSYGVSKSCNQAKNGMTLRRHSF